MCLKLLSSRFEPDEIRNAGLNSFEPLKFALGEACVWQGIVSDPGLKETMPLFTIGLMRTLSRFSVSGEELEDPVYKEVMEKRDLLIARFKEQKSISDGADALPCADLVSVQKFADQGCYTTSSLSCSIEKGLIRTQRIVKALGGNAEVTR